MRRIFFGFWIFRLRWISLWLMIFGFQGIATASVEIGGYYENDIAGIVKRDGGLAAGDLSRLRLKIDAFNIHLEPRYYLLIKSESLPLVGVTSLDQLVWDKVYFKLYSPVANVTLGKQRIAWGTSYIWNPTDIFNPFVLSFAVREEEETNVEAVRVEVPMGVASGLDGYVLTGKPWEETKKGVKGKVNIGLFDLSVSYVDLGKSSFQLGFDSAGEVFGVGVRNEIVLKSPAGDNGYIQSVWGWDYTLENGIGLNMEYFFNGLGKRNKDEYDWDGLHDGKIAQLGMDYLFFSVNRILDEITQVRGSLIVNLDDLSWMIYPQYTRNVMQNLDLSLETMLVGGELGSEYNPTDQQVTSGLAGSKLVLVRITYSF